MQCHEIIFIDIIPGLDNHANSSWYYATYTYKTQMYLPAEFIVNGGSKGLSFKNFIDRFSMNL